MEVGDYVRTEEGIKRVLKYTYNEKYENGHCVWFDNKDYGILFTDEEVNKMKPSPNIIDLIEVGDFIGKTIVEEVKKFDDGTRVIVMADGFDEYNENEDFLKAGIVTKEQFESMEYKVGE